MNNTCTQTTPYVSLRLQIKSLHSQHGSCACCQTLLGNVQVLSARSVMYPLLWHGRHSNPTPATPDPGGAGSTPHMTVEELTEDQVARSGLFQDDLIHPTDKGHRIYAEILINYLQGILLHEV